MLIWFDFGRARKENFPTASLLTNSINDFPGGNKAKNKTRFGCSIFVVPNGYRVLYSRSVKNHNSEDSFFKLYCPKKSLPISKSRDGAMGSGSKCEIGVPSSH